MKVILLIILLLSGISLPLCAQQKSVVMDSSRVSPLAIPDSSLTSYRTDKEFNYKIDENTSLSIWDRFWIWLWQTLEKAAQRESVKRGLNIAIWTVSITLILYAIYKITGMEKRFFFRSADPAMVFAETERDIQNMDLPKAISEAEQEGNYRLALRLQYLNSLKQLSERRLITYAINKTNHDYVRELHGSKYADSFSRLTLLYEFGWYGEFDVDKDIYERIREIFLSHQKMLLT